MKVRGMALVLVSTTVLLGGCLFAPPQGTESAVIWESEFDSMPDELNAVGAWSIDDGMLVSDGCRDDVCGLRLVQDERDVDVSAYLEFEFRQPRGSGFGFGFNFRSWEDGLYMLWVYQRSSGDTYQLLRYARSEYDSYLVAEGRIQELYVTRINTAELVIVDGSLRLVVNGRVAFEMAGIGADASHFSLHTFNTDFGIDYLRITRP
jgi:hypothetical protein